MSLIGILIWLNKLITLNKTVYKNSIIDKKGIRSVYLYSDKYI